MKKMILIAILAIMTVSAKSETLTGKITLVSDISHSESALLQVCMNGSCTDVSSDGTYSLNVTPSSISNHHASVGSSMDLYRLGQYVISASGKQVALINMNGQRVASGKGNLDISSVPAGLYMATDGKQVLRFNSMTSSGFATAGSSATPNGVSARVADTAKLLGVAYVVVNGDTLREIPVTSWNLPSGYMVQRNATASVTKGKGDSTKLVYWSTDSIAYVVTLELDGGSSNDTVGIYTGFIYAYYDSTSYRTNAKLFSYFVRTYEKDTIKAYSDIFSVNARSGNFGVTSDKFHLTTYMHRGYSYVPALDSVKKWKDSTSLNYDSSWISVERKFSIDTVTWVQNEGYVNYDSSKQSDIIAGLIENADTAIKMFGEIDSVSISWTVIDTTSDTTKFRVYVPGVMSTSNISNLYDLYVAGGHTGSYNKDGAIVSDTGIKYALRITKENLEEESVNGVSRYMIADVGYNYKAISNVRILLHVKN